MCARRVRQPCHVAEGPPETTASMERILDVGIRYVLGDHQIPQCWRCSKQLGYGTMWCDHQMNWIGPDYRFDFWHFMCHPCYKKQHLDGWTLATLRRTGIERRRVLRDRHRRAPEDPEDREWRLRTEERIRKMLDDPDHPAPEDIESHSTDFW